MKSALLHDHDGQRTFVVVLNTGDEVMTTLAAFASAQRLHAAQFTAIGALSRGIVAFFEWTTKQYRNIPIDEQVEVLSIIGDISLDGDRPKVHAHAVLGKPDATACGGHLVEGHVRPTLEIVITESPAHLRRRYDPESGLALINPTGNGRALR